MKRRSTALVLAALGTLLTAMTATATTPPTRSATKPLQFTSGGHALGFTPNAVVVATGSQALRVEFIGTQSVTPVAADSAAADGKAVPLTRVTYPGIWSGITLAYDAAGGLLRSTYTVAPGADPAQIGLRYNAPVAIAPDGDLHITFTSGAMRESAPVAWQDIAGRRIPVSVAFRRSSEREVGFALGPYDKARALTIDPTLTWNTFLGGAGYDFGMGVAVDTGGNAYVTGYSAASWGNPKRAFAGGYDASVAKLDPNGVLQWNTFLGWTGSDSGYGIAVDASGNVYVTGGSTTTWGVPLHAYAGNYDVLVAKLDANGVLLWHTFLGGTNLDCGYGIAVDANGDVYVTGQRSASWGAPVSPELGSFVVKLNTDGILQWNTFLGGEGGKGIAVDAGGYVSVTGTSSTTWGAPLNAFGGVPSDAFVARLDPNGALLWNTFLGGSDRDYGNGIAVDASGNLYVAGQSFAVWGTPIGNGAGGYEAFVAKLQANGALLWHRFFGGAASDSGLGIAADNASSALYVTGVSASTWGNPVRAFAGIEAALVAKLDFDGALTGNTFLGGTSMNSGRGIAVDASSNVTVAGDSYTTWGSPIRAFGGGTTEAFVAKLATKPDGPPVALNQALSTPEDIAKAITLSATYAGGALTYTVVAAPAHGSLSGTPPDLGYHPAADFSGVDSFTFKANDGATDSNTATITITVTPVNDAPGFAKGSDLSVVKNAGPQTVTGWATGVSAGPVNEVGQTPSFSVTNNNAVLFAAQPSVSAAGTLTYTPATNAVGRATVAVQLRDDGGQLNGGQDTSVAQTFTITVGPDVPPPQLAIPTWNTFFGGPYSYGDDGRDVAIDADGNVFVIGSSHGTWGSPIRPASESMYERDTFVAKFDTNGRMMWNTFLGATITDSVSGIAVDAGGNVSVTGLSASAWGAPIHAYAGGNAAAFVAKLDANGTLLWNTFQGMGGGGIAVDAGGNAYVTGGQNVAGISDVLVIKLDTNGAVQWSTLRGGIGHDFGRDIAVDASGSVYVSGRSYAAWGLPIRPWTGGLYDVFVAKLDTSGALLWNTFLGAECFSTGTDPGYSAAGFAVDASGNVYVSGMSWRTWGTPILPAAGERDAFVAKLDTNGVFTWNTFLGAAVVADSASDLAVDVSGNVYVSGGSYETWGDPIRPIAGGGDAFVAKLDTDGVLLWNAFLGNADVDYGYGIAVDASDNVYVTGFNQPAYYDPNRPEQPDVFVTKLGYEYDTYNDVPIADAGPDQSGTAGQVLSFSGAASSDVDGTVVSYSWSWGDGTANGSGVSPTHAYATAGTWTVTLTVADDAGATGTDSLVVTVAPTPVNLALNKPATASSKRKGTSYAASNAVDGSTATSWMSSNSSSAQWVRVDLGSKRSISSTRVYWPATYYAKAFKVETSTRGTTWTQQYSTTSGDGSVTNVAFPAVSARYVRVTCTSPNNALYYGVAELEVYQ